MKVLETWIDVSPGVRGALLKRDGEEWYAQAVLEAVNSGDTLYLYAEGPSCATTDEALEQLEGVALPLPVDELFEYAVPPELDEHAQPGCRVRVRVRDR